MKATSLTKELQTFRVVHDDVDAAALQNERNEHLMYYHGSFHNQFGQRTTILKLLLTVAIQLSSSL